MKTGYRVVLFAELDAKQENISTMLTGCEKQLALSDSQLQEIDHKLLVRNMEELERKFPALRTDTTLAEPNRKQEESLCSFAQRITKQGGDRFEVWYPRPQIICSKETTQGKFPQKLTELKLGIEAFFKQGGVGERKRELLILNIAPKDLLQTDVRKRVELYFDTVNHKKDLSQYISLGILPGADMGGEGILTLTGKHGIILCIQYETEKETSAEAFAEKGMELFRQKSEIYERHAFADYVTCCYPNLTAEIKGYYIGAAFVVAGMLCGGAEEGAQSLQPKELYPYSPLTREEITEYKYGSMLASETPDMGWGAKQHMILLTARALSYENGCYRKIEEVLNQEKRSKD